MTAVEVNFDGIVGPTHHYGGLGHGNLASQRNARRMSSPRAAALQGIAKMRLLVEAGLPQAVLLPHERPHLPTLRRLGFRGTDSLVLERAFRDDPGLVSAVSSASAMWAANAATVSPASDTDDGRVHFTPANLGSHLHRSIEASTTEALLRLYFGDEQRFVVHGPVPTSGETGDEGAANHTRLTPGSHGEPGVALFVHGGRGGGTHGARQAPLASQAVARQHGLAGDRVVVATQSPRAIDAGVFHNDVIAVGDRDLLLVHEAAFVEQERVYESLRRTLGDRLRVVEVPTELLPVEDAVASYLFNSQLVGLPDGSRLLLAPADIGANARAAETASWMEDEGIATVTTQDLRQSMSNGGGPACLRLRVVIDEAGMAAMHQGALMDPSRLDLLERWVLAHYRDELSIEDLGDPSLLEESRRALDELTSLLGLGSVYEFQGRATQS